MASVKASKTARTIRPEVSNDYDKRLAAMRSTMESINKSLGEGSIVRYGDTPKQKPLVTSSGSLNLDIALGVGGFPKGRIIEIYGPESSGKTTSALQFAAQVQKEGGIVAFVDAEHALDPTWAVKLGVDIDSLIISQPDTGEQALEIVDRLVNSALCDLIIVDSVAALTPKAEIEGEMGDSHVGLQARLMSQGLRKINGAARKTGTTVFFINQLREKIGVMFGSPETTTGGKALKFYASIRLDIRRIEALKEGTEAVGNKVRIKVVKNKVAPPFRQAELELMFANGFSIEGEMIDLGVEMGFIRKGGSWFTVGQDLPGFDDLGVKVGDQLGQGKANAKKWLEDNPEAAAIMLETIREHYFSSVVVDDSEDAVNKETGELLD